MRNFFNSFFYHNDFLLKLFDQHIESLKQSAGKEISLDNYHKYVLTRNRLALFMQSKYRISDIRLKDINYSFLCDFETYLKTVHHCGQNTTMKFLQRLRTIVLIAKNNGRITIDPFNGYKFRLEKSERAFLTEQELNTLLQTHLSCKRLEQVRDVFVFSCFTGLAYIDVRNLQKENIHTSFDNRLWIIGQRKKTGVVYRVPLLDIPQKILNKYQGTLSGELLLPLVSHQKTNAHLKKIAAICKIHKPLTFHIARHTFATTVTLSKGVTIESVSKMLGHTNIKTTQIYARITDSKISNEMNVLEGKLNFKMD